MERFRILKPVIIFHLVLNVLLVLFITGASYYHTPLKGVEDTAIYFFHLCALQTTVAGILYFLSLHKWSFRILFSLLFILYCGFSFWAYSQDISVTTPLMHAVIETRPDIAVDLITLPYIFFMLAAFMALVFILKMHAKILPTQGFMFLVVPALLCIALFFVLEKIRPGSLKNRLPYNVIQSISAYYNTPSLQLNTELGEIAKVSDSIKLVFVVGETVRADHTSINGYHRNTTPLLASEENFLSFTSLYTSNTYTGSSLPQILTDKNLEDTRRLYTSLYSVANKAGYRTTWIGNQSLESSFSPIVYNNKNVLLIDKYKSEFSFSKKLDEEMLPPLDSVLKQSSQHLITLHMMGSHWWYENRYADEHRVYTPVIDSKYIPSQSREQMINSYDNTIIYLDYFLNEIVERLKKETIPAVMVYVSDHGELLGEDGKWLHAQKGEALHYPAYFIWFSEKYKEKFPEKAAHYSSLQKESMTTDTIFYTMLNLLNIEPFGN